MRHPLHRYKLRPGYGSNELLLEFESQIDDRLFVEELFRVLTSGGFTVTRLNAIGIFVECAAVDFAEDKQYCVWFSSPYGTFTVSVDEWGGIFGHGLKTSDQSALRHADKLLKQSGLFERIEVDSFDYRLPPT